MKSPAYHIFFTAFFVLLFTASFAIAQDRQIPFDSAGKILSIDKSLEHSLQLFDNIEYFEQAVLFQKPDGSYIAEITRDSSHVIIRTHIPWTSEMKELTERRITEYARSEHPEFYLNQEGRGNLMLGIMGLSVFAYGPSLPVMAGMTDPAQITGAYLLFGGGAYLLASNLTSRMEITKAEASFANSGGFMGLAHGALLAMIIQGNEVDQKGFAALSTLASIGELAANYSIAKRTRMTTGTANVITSGGIYGGMHGLLLCFAISESPDVRLASALTLGGSIGGYFVGDMLARDHSYTEGDASALSLAMFIGAAVPLANLLAARTSDHTVLAGMTMAGSIAATVVIHKATRNTGFTSGQGLTIGLGTSAGLLMGTGFALLAKTEIQATTILASLGTIAGYAITFATIAGSQTATQNSRYGASGSFDLQLNPTGVAMAFQGSKIQNEIMGMKYHF